jgi:hypothetical protein
MIDELTNILYNIRKLNCFFSFQVVILSQKDVIGFPRQIKELWPINLRFIPTNCKIIALNFYYSLAYPPTKIHFKNMVAKHYL